MLLINSLTNDSFQNFNLTGIPGVQIQVLLKFLPRVQRWFMDISYGTFQANGIGVVSSPNLLRQWKNIIPFGIACINVNGLDPYAIDDWVNGASSFLLLDSVDVANVEQQFFTAPAPLVA